MYAFFEYFYDTFQTLHQLLPNNLQILTSLHFLWIVSTWSINAAQVTRLVYFNNNPLIINVSSYDEGNGNSTVGSSNISV